MGISLMESRRRILLNTPHVESASGDIAMFNTDMAAPLKSCVVTINPVQSGTGDPSPDNVRPISGWTGCNVYVRGINLWDGVWENGKISESTGQNSGTSELYARSTNNIPFPTGNSFYGYITQSLASSYKQFYYDKDKNYLGYGENAWNTVISDPINNSYASRIKFMRFYKAGGDGGINTVSVNVPSSNHDSYAYAGDSKTLSWEAEAGTVYGGTLDMTTGLLTVTHKRVLIKNKSWSYGGGVFYCSTSDQKAASGVTVVSDTYASGGNASNAGGAASWGNYSIRGHTQGKYIYVKDTAYTSATSFKTARGDAAIIYPLATPVTYQLTPQQLSTLKGVNNIWADCGPVNIKYWTH